MTITQKIIMVSAAALLIVGCSDPEVKPVATEPDIVSLRLSQSAEKAAKALDTIAHIEKYRTPAAPPLQDDYATASQNLTQPISLRWSGPIEQVTRTLAERAGLRFRVKGRQPGVPLTVNVDAYQQPILQVLRDIGLQAGTRADVVVDQNEGVVEVSYAAFDQSR